MAPVRFSVPGGLYSVGTVAQRIFRRPANRSYRPLLAADRLRPVFLFEAVRTRRVQPSELASVDPQLLTLRNLNTRQDYVDALSTAGFGDQR